MRSRPWFYWLPPSRPRSPSSRLTSPWRTHPPCGSPRFRCGPPVFWDKVSPQDAERYSSLLAPESPVIIGEGSRWTVSLDISMVKAPAYVFAAERDAIKATALSQLAQRLGAKFAVLPGEGHGIPLNPVWHTVAADIDQWLTGLFG
jgi:hypothetical protein